MESIPIGPAGEPTTAATPAIIPNAIPTIINLNCLSLRENGAFICFSNIS